MNYGEIRTEFQSLLHRSDCTNAQADIFLTLALQRCARVLRTPPQETLATLTVADPWVGFPVPSNLLQVIGFLADDDKVSPLLISSYADLVDSGPSRPTAWARFGQAFQFKPTPAVGTEITLYYYSEFPAFTSDADETVLSVIAPDLLIYGALSYAADHFIDERGDKFEARYEGILSELVDAASMIDGAPVEIPPLHRLDGDY